MVYLAVSEAAQKNCGDSHNPIRRALGTTILISSTSMLLGTEGRT